MKKHLLKFKSWLLLLCMIVGATSSALADSYTITFSTGSGDGTTASTSTACSTIVSDGNTYLSGKLVTATKVYYGGSDGLKMGTSSAAGAIKMNLASNVTPTSIVVNAKLYNSSKAATLKVNGSTAQNISSSFSDLTFNITSEISYIQLETSKYCWIKSITVNYAAAAKEDPEITFNNGSVKVGNTLDLSTLFTSNSTGAVTYSITAGDSYASLDGSILTGGAVGSVTVKAEQAATGNYNAGEATATISVEAAKTLSSIAVTTAPTKTTYIEGETFDPTGMVVTATYSDETTEDVTASCTFSPSTALTTSDTEITVSYTENAVEETATQAITVNAIPTHTVTFSVNGVTSTGEVKEGAAIEFPNNPADVNGKTFVGWVAVAIDGTTDDAPEFVSSANMGNSDITYYAVFALASGGGSSNVTKSYGFETESDSDWTIDGPVRANSDAKTGSYAGRINTNNTYVTFNNKVKVKEFSFAFKRTSNNSNYNVYIETSEDNSNWTAKETYEMGTFNNGTYLTKTLEFDGTQELYVRFHCYNTTAVRYVDDVTITYVSGGVSYSGYCTTVADAVAVTGVSVDATASVNVGETTTLTATVSPDDATNKNVTWASSDESIATVDENGVVTGVAAGIATITVTSVADNTMTAGCTVTVTPVAVTGVSVDATASVNVGKTTTLTATVSPDNATNKSVTWESSNETIATVDENGVVTGVAAGEATITVTSVADNTKTATCTVTVSVVPGTVARPYTVAEAIDAIDNEGNVTDVYVEGIISQIDSYESSYHSLTYWISADGTTESQQFEVYSGKGIGGANFSSINDLEIGDRVVVKGNIKKYNDIYEFNYNNQLVSRVEKPASDLAKTNDIALDVKNNALTANIADHISSSSAGAYTYESADETVATVSAEGVVTGLKVGTTTITVNQAATLSYKAGTVEIPVTVADTRVAATTIPAINISSLPNDDEGGTIVVVDPVKADEGVTFSFESSDENVLYIEGNDYIVMGIGTATVTVTATASNSALYKNVTKTFEVTVNAAVKSKNVIELAFDSNSTVWGTNLEGIVGGSQGFDGTIVATSSNPKVLTVAVDAEGNVTVTPVAVGSATVTFSAAETASFLAAENVQQVFTITAPAGITTAPASGEVTYTFDFTDNTDWGFPTNYLTGENTYTKDGKTITLNTPDDSNGYKFNTNVILIGKSGATLTLPAFDKPVTKITTTGVSGASGKVTQNIYVDETAVSTETTSAKDDHEYIINPEYQAPGTIYTFKVTNANNTQLSDLTVHMNQDPSETVTINKHGYATYCSVNPMDFSETEGYTAWYVSNITSDGVITFNKITGTIKGGQGVLLYNIDADEVNTSNVNVKFASSENELEGNLLVGTTAPTYVEESGSVYGLSGDSFKKNSAPGTIGANKAYLDANDIPNEVQAFTFVFEDDETGITETRTVTREEVESIFNLAGQRLNRTQKGINIVNGKKVFIKK